MTRTGGPHLSAAGERGRGRGRLSWAGLGRARERERRREELGRKRPKDQEGGDFELFK